MVVLFPVFIRSCTYVQITYFCPETLEDWAWL
jgi:hypothetical protein